MTSKASNAILHGLPFVFVMSLGLAAYFAIVSLQSPPDSQIPKRNPPLVRTQAVVVSDKSELELEVQGEVVPFREVALAAEVAGRIESKGAASLAGNFVTKDELLLQIDPSYYDLEVRRIQQSISEVKVSIEEMDVEQTNNEHLLKLAKSELELQNRNVGRIEALQKQRVSSQAAYDAAQQKLLQAMNTVQLRENQDRLIQTRRSRFLTEKEGLLVQLEKALLDRRRTEIRSPLSGIIMEDPVEAGDYVQKGTTLVKIEDISKVEIDFDLKLDQLRWIWASSGSKDLGTGDSYALPPLKAKVEVEVEGRRFEWDAILSRYDGAGLNPATRTVPCVAIVDDPRGGRAQADASDRDLPGPPTLLRGMFVTIKIAVPTKEPLVEVAVTALRPGSKIWLCVNDQLSIRDVDVAQVLNDRVLLFPASSDVAIGDRVVVTPLPLAANTMEIREEVSSTASQGGDVLNATKAVSSEVAR